MDEIKTKFNELLRIHGPEFMRLCFSMEMNEQQALELYNQSCLQLYKSLLDFKGESSIATWAYRVVLNTCYKHVRDATRKPLDKPSGKIGLDKTRALSRAEDSADAGILIDHVLGFPQPERTIMGLYLTGHTHQEIAEVVDLSLPNVAQKISRLKKKIIHHMEKGMEDL